MKGVKKKCLCRGCKFWKDMAENNITVWPWPNNNSWIASTPGPSPRARGNGSTPMKAVIDCLKKVKE